jgi:hypothetical protein
LSIYLLRSGIGGQGGTEDRNTYLLISGSLQGAQTGRCTFTGHPQEGKDFPHELQEADVASANPSNGFLNALAMT